MALGEPMRLSTIRLVSSFSVRTRIVLIALIPVLGFAINGLNFASGEQDVEAAFNAAKRAASLADASRDFKAAISKMRINAKDFVANPSDDTVKQFEDNETAALLSLDTVQALSDTEKSARLPRCAPTS